MKYPREKFKINQLGTRNIMSGYPAYGSGVKVGFGGILRG